MVQRSRQMNLIRLILGELTLVSNNTVAKALWDKYGLGSNRHHVVIDPDLKLCLEHIFDDNFLKRAELLLLGPAKRL